MAVRALRCGLTAPLLILLLGGAAIVEGCGDDNSVSAPVGSPAVDYEEVFDHLKQRSSFHVTVEVDAPASLEELSGNYEQDFIAPNKYRTYEQGGELVIMVGNRVFFSRESRTSWVEFEDPSPNAPKVRDVFAQLEAPCRVETRDDSFLLHFRSKKGPDCGSGGSAIVEVDKGDIRRVTSEVPTDVGTIKTVLAFDFSGAIEPIEVPQGARLTNDPSEFIDAPGTAEGVG